MSEYQYYEFQAIDRPLTAEEQQSVSKLSSRVEPHPRRAVFVYHYSDLRANAKELLAKYYDAMFYIANWGTTRLLFRFPRHLIDVKQLEPYCVRSTSPARSSTIMSCWKCVGIRKRAYTTGWMVRAIWMV